LDRKGNVIEEHKVIPTNLLQFIPPVTCHATGVMRPKFVKKKAVQAFSVLTFAKGPTKKPEEEQWVKDLAINKCKLTDLDKFNI